MKELFGQFVTLWNRAKPMQKAVITTLFLSLIGFCTLLLMRASSSQYVTLYPQGALSHVESQEVKSYLESSQIPFQEKNGIQVLDEQVERIRMELISLGIGKHEQGKGFELFDTNTWIKGEKELQVLEMRALKGQLEHDLAGFENIKHANVILDLAPSRTFGSQAHQTKASVILTLMPQTHLSSSQLRAITCHLAGAVRGLEPHMVAISDTKGHLYQAIDPDHEEQAVDRRLILEEEVQQKIEALLSTIMGSGHFHSSVQLNDKLNIAVILDRLESELPFAQEIHHQLQAIGRGYDLEVQSVIDFVPFEKKRSVWVETKERGSYMGILFFGLMVILALLSLIPLFRRLVSKSKEKETKINFSKLANSVRQQEPATIATMLSYLEPERAEKILAAFPEEFQEQVLAELEREP